MLHYLLFLSYFIFSYGHSSIAKNFDGKVLIVGEERFKETLPLKSGSQLYKLQGLKTKTWYEVKISYPASIPATFSLQLVKDDLETVLNFNRRLLNTEKLIFKSDCVDSHQCKQAVLVTVEPEGIVAIPHTTERKDIIFNIVCDELLLGIPHKVWWVAILVVLCLVMSFIIPRFLPEYMLPRNRSPQEVDQNAYKEF